MTKKELRKALYAKQPLTWAQVQQAAGRDLRRVVCSEVILAFPTPRDAGLWFCGLAGGQSQVLGGRAVLAGDQRHLQTYAGLPVRQTRYAPPIRDRRLVQELREDGLAHVDHQAQTVIWYGEAVEASP